MKKNLLIGLLALTLVGCNNSNSSNTNSSSVISSTNASSNSSLSNQESSGVNTSSSSSSNKVDDFKKNTNLKMITPAGAPALAFLNYLHDDNYETNTTPANIIASMNSGTYDIVVVDTIGGMNAITKGAEYKMAATITFGNYYIYSTGNDDNGIMENGDKIISFGMNQTPDKIFNYLYPDIEVTEYVAGVADTSPVACRGAYALENGLTEIDYVFMAEPVMFAMMSNKDCTTYGKGSEYVNIQEEFVKKNSNAIISGAAIFVKNSTFTNKKEEVLDVLNNIKTNIEEITQNPLLAKTRIETLGDQAKQKERIGIASGAAFNVLKDNNSVGLGYLDYTNETLIEKINGYYSAINMVAPSEENYLKD